MSNIIEISNLQVAYRYLKKDFLIIRGLNLTVGLRQSVALAGESGCGKTMTARAVMRILPKNCFYSGGSILMGEKDLLEIPESQMAYYRGTRAGIIFQEPSSYLNPVFTIGSQISEAIKGDKNKKEKREIVLKMLNEVGLNSGIYYQYPHQLSGGMQQRAMIAMALVNNPPLLIADEPTTALDVTTASEIIALLNRLADKYGLSLIFITHDIALAKSFANMLAVMYAGRIVEIADPSTIFSKPLHPYTEMLISCLPERYKKGQHIKTIPGSVPDFRNLPEGCAFHPRCNYKKQICTERQPAETRSGNTTVRCFRYGNSSESE